MSQTTSPGLVDASRWIYVSAVMATALRERADKTNSERARIPKGIYRAASCFFQMVNEAHEAEVPTKPLGSASNYAIAARAVRTTAQVTPKAQDDYRRLFQKYTALLKALDPSQSSPPPDEADLRELSEFFQRIAEEGQAKASERRRSFDPMSNPQGR